MARKRSRFVICKSNEIFHPMVIVACISIILLIPIVHQCYWNTANSAREKQLERARALEIEQYYNKYLKQSENKKEFETINVYSN